MANELIEVLSTGAGLSIQDRGRSGWRRFGVPPGGALDVGAMKRANRLLANPEDAPVVELILCGQQLRVLLDGWVALAGADLGAEIKPESAVRVRAGDVLRFPESRAGLCAYLAVPGGVDAPRVFGSAACDARYGIGLVVCRGDRISCSGNPDPVGEGSIGGRIILDKPEALETAPPAFRLRPGPDRDLFSPAALDQLCAESWKLSPRSDRTGFRLEGAALPVPETIPSEPVVPGTLQIPGSGQPIVTMPDGPTVGGYPRIAYLEAPELSRFAQSVPGSSIQFQWQD